MSDVLLSTPAETAAALSRLPVEDAVSIPLLEPDACIPYVTATETLIYRPGRPVVGTGERSVYQDFEITMDVPAENLLCTLRDDVETLLNASLALSTPPLLPGPLILNDMVVQRYHAGSIGITPHRDHIRYTDLVAIVVLQGAGRYCISDDRAGTNPRAMPGDAGHLILMRAPGFAGRDDRPFHFVTDVDEPRISFGLRHDTRIDSKLE